MCACLDSDVLDGSHGREYARVHLVKTTLFRNSAWETGYVCPNLSLTWVRERGEDAAAFRLRRLPAFGAA